MKTAIASTVSENNKIQHILLRSSWQGVNIGDISHTPGMLALLDKHLPNLRITLWSCLTGSDENGKLHLRFPNLKIVHGSTASGQPDTEELRQAFVEADFLLHGSGPAIVASADIEAWKTVTGKPYGIYGVTVDPLRDYVDDSGLASENATLAEQRRMIAGLPDNHIPADLRKIIEEARFLFCRDTLSLEYLKSQRLAGAQPLFAPDCAFGIDIRDDERARAFMASHGLEPGRFICVIPRLRYTPYHLIHGTPPTPTDLRRVKVSETFREADFQKVRDALIALLETTDMKVAIVPEMTYQIEVGRAMIADRLPAQLRGRVVCRPNFWLPYEASSLFAQSAAVLSMDNHSPIFSLAQGIPTVNKRQPSDTIKGQMWPDLGMGDWFVELDRATKANILQPMAEILACPAKAAERAQRIAMRVRSFQDCTMKIVAEKLAPVASRDNGALNRMHGIEEAEPEPANGGDQRLRLEQLRAWESLRLGMFIHFGMSTYQKGDIPVPNEIAPLSLYNPTALDVAQWVGVARDMGARYAILTTKHVAGHCLWPSNMTDYHVGNTSVKTDVVELFVRECEKKGVKPGFYYCSWDDYHRFGSRTPSDYHLKACVSMMREPYTTRHYQDFQMAQVEELLTRYGDIFEVWIDIPGVLPHEFRKDLYAMITARQPQTIVMMNNGISDGSELRTYYTWPSDLLSIERYVPDSQTQYVKWHDIQGGRYYIPGEVCDIIGQTWFHCPNDRPKSDEELLGTYLLSVSRGANLLLNVAPGPDGRIADYNVEATRRLRKNIDLFNAGRQT